MGVWEGESWDWNPFYFVSDEEYDRIQSASQDRIKTLDEKILETQELLERQIEEMDIARELVGFVSESPFTTLLLYGHYS